jgi:hypothetical protein
MMKITAATLLLCLAFNSLANGFVSPPGKAATFAARAQFQRNMASSPEDDIAALRAAAAKAREEADMLSNALGKKSTGPTKVNAKTSLSINDAITMTTKIDFEGGDAVSQTMLLDELTSNGDFALWKSAAKDQSLRTFPVSLQFLESRTAGKVNGESLGISGEGEVGLDDFKYATLGVTLVCSVVGVSALAFLPDNVGATVCYLVAVIPILFLGVGSTAPAAIANLIVAARGKSDDDTAKVDRICRHESAHFLCGYLCGLPVKKYTLLDSGIPCVEFHPSSEGDATSREYSPEEVATLAVVAMSGSVGEVIEFGSAKGGENDLMGLEGVFRRSKEFIGAQKQQEMTRWGALTAFQLLSKNKDKYDALVDAFRSKKSVAECVALLESR